jgi:hypothetical protein
MTTTRPRGWRAWVAEETCARCERRNAPEGAPEHGFAGAACEALTKLGVQWEPGAAERAYNEGRSTQIPVHPVVRVTGRFARRLRYGNAELVLEK